MKYREDGAAGINIWEVLVYTLNRRGWRLELGSRCSFHQRTTSVSQGPLHLQNNLPLEKEQVVLHGTHVCICVYSCTYVHACTYRHTRTWRPEVDVEVLLNCSLFEIRPITELGDII